MTRRRGPAAATIAPRARLCARSTATTRTTPPTPPPGSHPRHAGPAAPLHPGTSRDSSTHMGCRPYPQAPKQRLLTHTFAPDRHKGRGEPLRRQRGEGMPSPGAWGDQPAAGSRHQTAGRRPAAHARAMGTSSHRVVYCGVRLSCFMPQLLTWRAVPALPQCTVPFPWR